MLLPKSWPGFLDLMSLLLYSLVLLIKKLRTF